MVNWVEKLAARLEISQEEFLLHFCRSGGTATPADWLALTVPQVALLIKCSEQTRAEQNYVRARSIHDPEWVWAEHTQTVDQLALSRFADAVAVGVSNAPE